MVQTVGVKDFARAMWGDYWARMSGPLSVPAAALALWVSNDYAKIFFVVTAFVCLWITAYRLWKPEREKTLAVTELIERRPKFKLSFDMKDAGCIHRNILFAGIHRCDFYRIRLDAEFGNIPESRARLISVSRGESPLLQGDYPPLPIVHRRDGITTVHAGTSEFVDLLALLSNQTIHLCVEPARRTGSVDWDYMFSLPGDYKLSVAITSPHAITAHINLLLRWTLDRTTSELVCLTSG